MLCNAWRSFLAANTSSGETLPKKIVINSGINTAPSRGSHAGGAARSGPGPVPDNLQVGGTSMRRFERAFDEDDLEQDPGIMSPESIIIRQQRLQVLAEMARIAESDIPMQRINDVLQGLAKMRQGKPSHLIGLDRSKDAGLIAVMNNIRAFRRVRNAVKDAIEQLNLVLASVPPHKKSEVRAEIERMEKKMPTEIIWSKLAIAFLSGRTLPRRSHSAPNRRTVRIAADKKADEAAKSARQVEQVRPKAMRQNYDALNPTEHSFMHGYFARHLENNLGNQAFMTMYEIWQRAPRAKLSASFKEMESITGEPIPDDEFLRAGYSTSYHQYDDTYMCITMIIPRLMSRLFGSSGNFFMEWAHNVTRRQMWCPPASVNNHPGSTYGLSRIIGGVPMPDIVHGVFIITAYLEEWIKDLGPGPAFLFPLLEYIGYVYGGATHRSRVPALIMHYVVMALPFPARVVTHILYNMQKICFPYYPVFKVDWSTLPPNSYIGVFKKHVEGTMSAITGPVSAVTCLTSYLSSMSSDPEPLDVGLQALVNDERDVADEGPNHNVRLLALLNWFKHTQNGLELTLHYNENMQIMMPRMCRNPDLDLFLRASMSRRLIVDKLEYVPFDLRTDVARSASRGRVGSWFAFGRIETWHGVMQSWMPIKDELALPLEALVDITRPTVASCTAAWSNIIAQSSRTTQNMSLSDTSYHAAMGLVTYVSMRNGQINLPSPQTQAGSSTAIRSVTTQSSAGLHETQTQLSVSNSRALILEATNLLLGSHRFDGVSVDKMSRAQFLMAHALRTACYLPFTVLVVQCVQVLLKKWSFSAPTAMAGSTPGPAFAVANLPMLTLTVGSLDWTSLKRTFAIFVASWIISMCLTKLRLYMTASPSGSLTLPSSAMEGQPQNSPEQSRPCDQNSSASPAQSSQSSTNASSPANNPSNTSQSVNAHNTSLACSGKAQQSSQTTPRLSPATRVCTATYHSNGLLIPSAEPALSVPYPSSMPPPQECTSSPGVAAKGQSGTNSCQETHGRPQETSPSTSVSSPTCASAPTIQKPVRMSSLGEQKQSGASSKATTRSLPAGRTTQTSSRDLASGSSQSSVTQANFLSAALSSLKELRQPSQTPSNSSPDSGNSRPAPGPGGGAASSGTRAAKPSATTTSTKAARL